MSHRGGGDKEKQFAESARCEEKDTIGTWSWEIILTVHYWISDLWLNIIGGHGVMSMY